MYVLWLMITTAMIAGCPAAGYVAAVIAGPEKVPAMYHLPAKRTLILVDDPEHQLGNPALTNNIAAMTGEFLIQNKSEAQDFVSVSKLSDLASQLGNDYFAMPIDSIARKLQAQQVIHVYIETVAMQYGAAMYRPTAVVQVKVIDVETGNRTFPRPGPLREGLPQPGHKLVVQMDYQNIDDESRTNRNIITGKLAEQIARDVSRLFYQWEMPGPGSSLRKKDQ